MTSRSILPILLFLTGSGCASLGGLDGESVTDAGDGASGRDGSLPRGRADGAIEAGRRDGGAHDASVQAEAAPPLDASADVGGELARPCGHANVFLDDFSATTAPGAGYSTFFGSWTRAPGTYTATYPGGAAGERAYSLLDGDFGDFDVTVNGHSIGGDGFGLVYATSGIGDGYAVVIHPSEYHGLFFKGLVPGHGDTPLASVTLPTLGASSPFSLHVVRTAGHVNITLSGAALPSPVTISGDENVTGPSAAQGRIGLILSLTSDREGAVFTDLDVAKASCASNASSDGGEDASMMSTG